MKILFSFAFLFLLSLSVGQARSFDLATDTTRATPKPTQLINNDTPTILKKGEILVVKIEETQKNKTVVRVHSSLGKLVKEFMEVDNQISMGTDKLQPGVYLIIIKQADKREVRKFLLTD